MPLQIISETSLDETLGSAALAEDVRASVHGGDCRVCGQPIPAGSAARLVAQAAPASRTVFVWAQHGSCGAPTTFLPDQESGVLVLSPHTYSCQMFSTQLPVEQPRRFWRRPTVRMVPIVGMVLHPSIDGATVSALPDGTMPATLLQMWRAKGFQSMPDHDGTEAPAGTEARLEGNLLRLRVDLTPYEIALFPQEAAQLREAGALHLFIAFGADPAALDASQIHELAGSRDAVMAVLPLTVTDPPTDS